MPGGVCSNDGLKWCRQRDECGGGICLPFEKNHATQIFHPMFLDRIKTYSTFRFMNWIIGNDVDPNQKVWSNRPKPTDARWANRGAPVEVMVDLANRIGVDPWFTIPHLSSDDYVRAFATYVREHLDPELQPYVEHSNEVWNDHFPQSEYARKEGQRLKLDPDPDRAKIFYHARRSVEIFKIWKSVFGSRRMTRVMGAFAAVPQISEGMLKFQDAYKSTDALAIAPYIDYGTSREEDFKRARTMTIDQLLDSLEKESLSDTARMVEEHAKLAKTYKLELIAYEGGQELVGIGPYMDDPEVNRLFDSANRAPRMKKLYLTYLEQWRRSGGRLFVHFQNCQAYSRFGRYGSIETLDQPRSAAPKFDALQEFIEKNPRWW
jgi:hypothetical protein